MIPARLAFWVVAMAPNSPGVAPGRPEPPATTPKTILARVNGISKTPKSTTPSRHGTDPFANGHARRRKRCPIPKTNKSHRHTCYGGCCGTTVPVCFTDHAWSVESHRHSRTTTIRHNQRASVRVYALDCQGSMPHCCSKNIFPRRPSTHARSGTCRAG